MHGKVELARVGGYGGAVVDRRDLQAVLVTAATACGVQQHLDCAFAKVERRGAGARVTCTSGATFDADVVVGADGIRSAVRAQLFGSEPYRWAGYYNFRGVSPVRLPVERSIRFVVGADCHIIACALSGGRSLFSFFLAGSAETHENWRVSCTDAERAVMQRSLVGCDPEIVDVIEHADAFFGSGIHDREPIAEWTTPELPMVTLLGDAAHPSTPHLGRGASAAIEDGVALARALAEHRDPPAGLVAYRATRQPLTAKMVLAARGLGAMTQSAQIPVADKLERLLGMMRAAQAAIGSS
ncbi:MAG: FAD-dependent monooxygenase [Polyangiaceae bacterium]